MSFKLLLSCRSLLLLPAPQHYLWGSLVPLTCRLARSLDFADSTLHVFLCLYTFCTLAAGSRDRVRLKLNPFRKMLFGVWPDGRRHIISDDISLSCDRSYTGRSQKAHPDGVGRGQRRGETTYLWPVCLEVADARCPAPWSRPHTRESPHPRRCGRICTAAWNHLKVGS